MFNMCAYRVLVVDDSVFYAQNYYRFNCKG